MQRTLSMLPLLSLLLTTVACPAPASEDAGDETGNSETGEGDGDGDGDDQAQDCATACAAQADCDLIGADELDDCVQSCEARIEAYELGFGSDCAQAQQIARHCLMTHECQGADTFVECEEVGIDAYYACSETQIPEVDALCECLAADAEPSPSDPLTPKELCVVDVSEMVVESYAADGQACLDAITDVFACQAAICEDAACDAEPAPDTCVCTEAEDAAVAACPSLL